MAEFLHILTEQYDYTQLGDEILRELSNKEFNSNDTRGPKSVSTFMIKLSELAPRLVIKQMTMLAKQLDSEVGPPLPVLPCPDACCCANKYSLTPCAPPLSRSAETCSPT